jgi:formate dehydrogenase major subunit
VPLDSTADKSNQPVYKSVVVRLERAGSGGPGDGQGSASQGPGSMRTDEPHHLA